MNIASGSPGSLASADCNGPRGGRQRVSAVRVRVLVAISRLALLAVAAVPACAEAGQASSGRPQTTAQAAPGEALIRTQGCGACHADLPRNTSVSTAGGLGPEFALSVDSVYAVLRARPATGVTARMPYFHLDEREAAALALYVGRGRPTSELRRIAGGSPALTAEHGPRLFAALNCAGCHAHPSHTAEVPGPVLALEGARVRDDWLRAYLRRPHAIRPFGTRPGGGTRMPDFALTAAEADSVAAFLLRRAPVLPPFEARPLTPHGAATVDTLMSERWGCLGCHAWQGRGGRIGPDLAGVATRLRPAYVRALLADPTRVTPGTVMPKPPLPAATLDRIASRLVMDNTVVSVARADSARAGYLSLVETSPIERPAERVAAAYAERCATCHGQTGGGDGYNAAFLRVRPAVHTDSVALSLRPDDTLHDAIAAGAFFLGRSAEMPAFADLDPSLIRELVAHVRALCRCAGPAWSRGPRLP